jgi:predicted RNA-binding Zn-ribbon protein involved in translation (DUF1610 family)
VTGTGGAAAAVIIYECPDCGERQAGIRRCEDCNLFMRRLGPGGECPSCGDPVLVSELSGTAESR